MVTAFCRQHLLEEDVLARLRRTTFGLVFPDMSEHEAQALLEKLQTEMKRTDFEIERCGVKVNLRSVGGLAAYRGNGMGRTDLLARARRPLKGAKADGGGKVLSLREWRCQNSYEAVRQLTGAGEVCLFSGLALGLEPAETDYTSCAAC